MRIKNAEEKLLEEAREEGKIVPVEEYKKVKVRNNGSLRGVPVAGHNTDNIEINLIIAHMPHINLNDEKAVQKRLDRFFTLYAEKDQKPTMAGLAACLNGMTRATLAAIARGEEDCGIEPKCINRIRSAYNVMEGIWESNMLNGKINPVTGIFMGKNQFGYRDQSEHILAPSLPQEEISAEDIRKKYLIEIVE